MIITIMLAFVMIMDQNNDNNEHTNDSNSSNTNLTNQSRESNLRGPHYLYY